MEAITRFRQRIASGELLLGTSVTFRDPLVTEALADSVDFVWIDTEHTPMGPEALSGHLLAARCKGIPALVRVGGAETHLIKQALDSGADGIIVPQILSAAEARLAVSACRYPPMGRRGYGPRVGSNYGRDGGPAYVERANKGVFVSVQIETVEALEAIDEILAVPGLDSVCFGPYDLSGALGVLGQLDHPKVMAAVEMVTKKARAAGLAVGSGMGTDPEYIRRFAELGVQWMHVGCDFGYLVSEADRVVAAIRRVASGQ